MSLMPAPSLEHVTDLTVFVAAPIEVGQTGSGQRRLIPITGGGGFPPPPLHAGTILGCLPTVGHGGPLVGVARLFRMQHGAA